MRLAIRFVYLVVLAKAVVSGSLRYKQTKRVYDDHNRGQVDNRDKGQYDPHIEGQYVNHMVDSATALTADIRQFKGGYSHGHDRDDNIGRYNRQGSDNERNYVDHNNGGYNNNNDEDDDHYNDGSDEYNSNRDGEDNSGGYDDDNNDGGVDHNNDDYDDQNNDGGVDQNNGGYDDDNNNEGVDHINGRYDYINDGGVNHNNDEGDSHNNDRSDDHNNDGYDYINDGYDDHNNGGHVDHDGGRYDNHKRSGGDEHNNERYVYITKRPYVDVDDLNEKIQILQNMLKNLDGKKENKDKEFHPDLQILKEVIQIFRRYYIIERTDRARRERNARQRVKKVKTKPSKNPITYTVEEPYKNRLIREETSTGSSVRLIMDSTPPPE